MRREYIGLCCVVVTMRVYMHMYIGNKEPSCVKHLIQVVFSHYNWHHKILELFVLLVLPTK